MKKKIACIALLGVAAAMWCGVDDLLAGDPGISVGRPVARPPEWATAQVELAAKSNAFAESLLDKFIDPQTGKPTFNVHVGQADDAVEGISTWDRFALLVGSDKTRAGMVRLWQYVYRKMVRDGSFTDGFYTHGYDAEHMGELYQMLWACMELDPHNAELAEQNRKVVDIVISRNYNAKTRLMKNVWLDTAGGDQRARRAKRPPRDEVLNGMFILAAFRAYMTTGDEKYRRWALEYGGKWNELAAANGGMMPFCADSSTGKATATWWTGLTKWGYKRTGVNLTARWLHAWPMAMMLMDAGDPKHMAGVNSSLDVLFGVRPDGLPVAHYDGQTWSRPKTGQGQGYMAWMAKLIDRPYSMTFDPKAGERIRKYYAALGKLPEDQAQPEKRLLEWHMFTYFGIGGEKYMRAAMDLDLFKVNKRHKRVADATKMPGSGDQLTEYALYRPISFGLMDGSFFGVYDNGRAGAPNPAAVGYRRDDDIPGLPVGLAALVRRVGPGGVHLELCNTTAEPLSVNLVGGFYGQHRIDEITTGSAKHKVGRRVVKLTVPARSLAEMKLTLKRFAFKPTLTPVTSKPAAWK